MPEAKYSSWDNSRDGLSIKPVSVSQKKALVFLLRFVSDYLSILLSVWLAIRCRESLLPEWFGLAPFTGVGDIYIYIIIPAAYIFFFQFDNLYIKRQVFWVMAARVCKSINYAIIFLLLSLYFIGAVKDASRAFVLFLWMFSIPVIITNRYLVKKALIKLGYWQIPVILIGAGKTAELILTAFQRDSGLGYEVVGIVEDNPRGEAIFHQYPVIGNFAMAEQAICRTGIKDVLIAAPGLAREELAHLIYRIQPYVKNIIFVPDLFGIPVSGLELETLYNEKAILLRVRNNLARWHNRLLKQLFDLVVSVVASVFVLIVAFVIGLLIYLDSPGPMLFSHTRIGRHGRTFPCYKFRTMVPNAGKKLQAYLDKHPAAREEWEQEFKLKDDPRITKVGRFLRRTSLDELPQFINVLCGEMSLVGPRPIIRDEIPKYEEYINDYYAVKPGITGMWQISGRNDIDYPERVRIDSWYIRNWSLWLDIMILVKTVKVVFERKGAY